MLSSRGPAAGDLLPQNAHSHAGGGAARKLYAGGEAKLHVPAPLRAGSAQRCRIERLGQARGDPLPGFGLAGRLSTWTSVTWPALSTRTFRTALVSARPSSARTRRRAASATGPAGRGRVVDRA